MQFSNLIQLAQQQDASDLHLSSNQVPTVRVNGVICPLNLAPISEAELEQIVRSIMTEAQQKEYLQKQQLDWAISLDKLGRCRCHCFKQLKGITLVCRLIASQIQTLEQLGLSAEVENLTQLKQGLVLVTGPTGSGKSSSLAALIQSINQQQNKHILSLEDPIEFIYTAQKSLINQREVGSDVASFSSGLKAALRADPDIILIGELRDLESISLALTAAETGHLVFASLHSRSAAQSINRIIDVFPAAEQSLVRSLLAESLQAILAQQLLPRKNGGRVLAYELLIATSAVRNLIRENQIRQIYSSMQTGRAQGMQTLEQHLEKLKQLDLLAD